MQNKLIYQQITRQRRINGKMYEFSYYNEPKHKLCPAFTEITVRRWNGYRWEVVHRFTN